MTTESGAGATAQKGRIRQLLPPLAVAVVILVAAMAVGMTSYYLRREPDPADFDFEVYQGEEVLGASVVNLSDVLGKGKPVVLNYWASDCAPCLTEMPALQRTHERHADQVLFLGLDIGAYSNLGTRQGAVKLLEELGITYSIGAPVNDVPVERHELKVYPTTLFFDGSGKLRFRWNGAISEQELESTVFRVLGPG